MDLRRSYFTKIDEGVYLPTEHAGGAWREDELHLAPVAGLLIHHLELWREANADPALAYSRFSIEVLGQIARDRIELSTEVVRPGRTIELVETTAVIGGRVTLRARAWLLHGSDTVAIAGDEYDPMPSPESFEATSWVKNWRGGFIRSIEAKQSDDTRPGRARAWIRSDVDVVDDEPSTPLANFVKVLDAANGVSVRQNPNIWMYPNVDLTVHLFRQPVGEWVGFDTRVAFGPSGVGLTSSVLHDIEGPVGAIQQSLTIRRLPGDGAPQAYEESVG